MDSLVHYLQLTRSNEEGEFVNDSVQEVDDLELFHNPAEFFSIKVCRDDRVLEDYDHLSMEPNSQTQAATYVVEALKDSEYISIADIAQPGLPLTRRPLNGEYELLLRIPRYCPEWTDHNVSDPGITLVELFAWLTDQMLMRFNQIPRKNYVAFLELLGIRLQPPTPAQVRLTFYLSTHLLEYTIPQGTEVATERTETQEAIIFTTDRDLVIAQPTIKHILSAPDADDTPRSRSDRTEQWLRQHDGLAVTHEFELFPQKPQSGNSFYLVIEPNTSLSGNVLAIAFTGASGTPTGINPKHPPRSWSAWDGESWIEVLLQEADDTTNGFSFDENTADNDSFEQSGDVILHLPERLPTDSFDGYKGHWIRCTLSEFDRHQSGYATSPRIKTIAMRSVGGAVQASQCVLVEEEILGIGNGKPGQSFEVETAPILESLGEEQLLVLPLGKPPETWQKVEDFAESKPHARHYVVDALAGTIQFGPLIREPQTLKKRTQARASLQQVLPAE